MHRRSLGRFFSARATYRAHVLLLWRKAGGWDWGRGHVQYSGKLHAPIMGTAASDQVIPSVYYYHRIIMTVYGVWSTPYSLLSSLCSWEESLI
jgi:hypothetical protein